MTSVRARVVVCGALLVGLLAGEAQAWGPTAQRAISRTAIQRIGERYPKIFQSDNQNYEADVVAGSEEGVQAVIDAMNIQTERDALEFVGSQIQLLREVRRYGIGSYFSYRMGLLSAVVSDVLLPYALDPSDQAKAIRAQMESDIDKHVTRYRFMPDRHLTVVRNLSQYIESYRPFYGDAKRMISEDYRSGAGYAGYLANAAPSFFGEAIQATSDVWYTILRAPDSTPEAKPSPEVVAWYFVDEMEYLLKKKHNVQEAMRKYQMLERVNPTLPAAYERIGDLFYSYGNARKDRDLRERAVQEWEKALDLPGCNSQRVSDKLADFYLEVGKAHVEAAREPGGYKRLSDALASFNRAIEYKHDNVEAERLLSETRTLKREMDEALETQTSIINSAEQVMKEAEQSERVPDYTNAIVLYTRAHEMFDKVSGQFPELEKAADDRSGEIQLRINTIKEEALKRAREIIAAGDDALEAKDFDTAINNYKTVEQALSPITDDPTSPHGKRRDELKQEAFNKVKQAEEAKSAWEQQQQQMQNQPGGPGAKPGAPAAPGGAARPGAPGAPAAPGPPGLPGMRR